MENKSKINLAEVIKPAGILTAICVIVTLLLAVINALTAYKIAANAEQKAAESRSKVLAAHSYTQLDNDGKVYGAVSENGEYIGVVIVTEATGYGGTIQVMTGIKLDNSISGVNILEMSETPGLGAKAKENSFLSQYKGESESGMSVKKDGGTIDAISGATITSRAVTQAVNEALETAKPYLEDMKKQIGGQK